MLNPLFNKKEGKDNEQKGLDIFHFSLRRNRLYC